MIDRIIDNYKKICLIKILLLFLISITSFGQEQDITIERSKNKVVIGGKSYYVHIVKPGETLYSLSKVYNVSQKEIAKENPNIVLGFRIEADQVLKIPFSKEINEKEEERSDKYIYHEMEEGQTIYYISRHYNVEVDEILKSNENIELDDLQLGQIIKIPRNKINLVKKNVFEEDEEYLYHKVKRNETLFSLSKKYNVSIEQIESANLEIKGIPKVGQFIKIPKIQNDTPETVLFSKDLYYFDSLDYQAGSFEFYESETTPCDTLYDVSYSEIIDVAILLPLFLNENAKTYDIDSSEVDEEGETIIKYIERSRNYIYSESLDFIEFYEGALIALDSLAKTGLKIRIHPYDTERSSAVVKEILGKREFRNMDLIIGPFSSFNLGLVADYARRYNINMISPVLTNPELLRNNPYIFQINPSLSFEFDLLTSFLSDLHDKNIVLIHSGDSLWINDINSFRYKLFKAFTSKANIEDVIYKEVVYHDSLKIDMGHSLSPDTQNVVIILSNHEPFVSSIVTKLHFLAKYYEYDVSLYGFPSWQKFDGIEPEYLHYLRLYLYSPYYVNYANSNVIKFIKRFREEYKSEPVRCSVQGFNYSFLGYDIVFYFLNAIRYFGTDFRDCIGNFQPDLLQSGYKFQRRKYYGGFENTGLYKIQFERNLDIQNLGTIWE